MSSTKRSSNRTSSFIPPSLSNKRRKTDAPIAQRLSFANDSEKESGSSSSSVKCDDEEEDKRKRELLKEIAEKQENLRRLKMAKLYKSKVQLSSHKIVCE